MDGKAKRWLRVLAVVTIFAGAATAVKAVLNHLFDDFKARGERESESLDEARERGILVAEVVADPTEAEFPGGRIRFGRAWVEERSLPTHRFVWFPVERRKGGYRLHFTAEVIGGAEDRKPILVPDETGYGQPLAPGVARVYDIPVASADVSGLRLSVVETPKDSRAKNIRFHPRW